MKMMRHILAAIIALPLMLSAQQQDASALYGEGVRAFYDQDYQTAIIKYTNALALKPNTIGYLYNRGLAYQKVNNSTAAGADFHHVLALDSLYLDAWYELGSIEMDAKRYDSANILFRRALQISGEDTRSLHQLAILCYYKRNNKGAIEIYNRILSINPKDEQALYKRGLAKSNSSDFTGAIRDFNILIGLNPRHTQALEERATCYMRINDLDNACRDFQKLMDLGNPRAKENIMKYCVKH